MPGMGFEYLKQRADKLQVNVPMRGEMRDALIAHHDALVHAGLGGTITDTARQLILEALSAHQGGVLVSAAAHRAYQLVYGWLMREQRDYFTKKLKEVDEMLAAFEKSPCHCCGRPMSEHDSNHR